MNLYVPSVVGIPEIVPVDAFSVKPEGKSLLTNDQVNTFSAIDEALRVTE